MPSPFGNVTIIGRPTWGSLPTIAGNFQLVNLFGTTTDEVGYGEGGYGEGGYDAPGNIIPATSTPNWTIVATK